MNWMRLRLLAAEERTQILTSTSKLNPDKNTFRHWTKHGAEFPNFLKFYEQQI
jgi:pyocin large subunit-like protein